jgi:phosphoglycerate kinase
MAKLTVNDLDVSGKRVLVRVDFNVPMEETNGQMVINDVTRIQETLPTLELLIGKGARIVLASHLGRPNGKREPSMSLRPVAAKLADMIHRPIAFVDDCVGEKVEKNGKRIEARRHFAPGKRRYYAEEEANDLVFAEKLARVAEVLSTTRSARRIGRTPRPKAWRG